MSPPTPSEIISARKAAGLTQTQAAALVGRALRTWQQWERENPRAPGRSEIEMAPGLWELFLLKTAA